MSLALLFAVVYGAVLYGLFAYGVNGYVLLWARRRWREPVAAPPAEWPSVTVQIPVYNERDVVARALRAAGRLRYPGPLEIQLLDDSDDDTTAIAAAVVAELARAGVAVAHVRRPRRVGFKAGALADGLATARGELVAIFDADFVPEEDFLLRTVPHFGAADVACVQARWGHLDRGQTALSRGQALGIDVHFAVEQRGRAAVAWPVAFNGSAGVWRRTALEDAGGWSADTLTEDLDLSYRAWLRGWRVAYVDGAVCPGEIPDRMAAFKAQQRRWARGSTQCARKLLGAIWRSRKPLSAKLQATLHLTHYAVHPLMLLSAVLSVPLGLFTPTGSLWAVLPPLAMATGGPIAMSVAVGRGEGVPWRRLWRDVGAVLLLGTGLVVSNTVAVVAGAVRGPAAFARTPKGGVRSSYRVAGDGLGVAELVCAVACAAIGVWLATRGAVTLVPILGLYAAGLLRVGVTTLAQSEA